MNFEVEIGLSLTTVRRSNHFEVYDPVGKAVAYELKLSRY